jgi:hypothetical protein
MRGMFGPVMDGESGWRLKKTAQWAILHFVLFKKHYWDGKSWSIR